jgi:hypothetical protein
MGVPATIGFRTRRSLIWLVLALLLGVPRPGAADGSLGFFKNYFVTGDAAVGAVALRGTGVGGFASGAIHIAGVPKTADILAAFSTGRRCRATRSTSTPRVRSSAARTRATARTLNPAGSVPCWSPGGARVMISYRADVLRFLDKDPITGKLQANGDHPVRLPDSGGIAAPSTGGASLVVVYREAEDPATPLRSIVIYDGAKTTDQPTRSFAVTMSGFYQASSVAPQAKITNIVGQGQNTIGERITFSSTAIVNAPFAPIWDSPRSLPPERACSATPSG